MSLRCTRLVQVQGVVFELLTMLKQVPLKRGWTRLWVPICITTRRLSPYRDHHRGQLTTARMRGRALGPPGPETAALMVREDAEDGLRNRLRRPAPCALRPKPNLERLLAIVRVPLRTAPGDGLPMTDPLLELFAEALELDAADLSDTTAPENTPEWDSLKAMEIVGLLEDEFDLSLSRATS